MNYIYTEYIPRINVRLTLYAFQVCKIIGSFLIYAVIYPVGEKQICMTSPVEMRRLAGIVVREVIVRHLYGQTLFKITEILSRKSEPVILGMTHYKELSVCLVGNNMYSRYRRRCEYFQVAHLFHIKALNACMT